MEWGVAIPMAAFILAAGGVLMTGLSNLQTRQQSASRDYVRQLEVRINDYKEELTLLRNERLSLIEKLEAMQIENVHLRIRVLELEKRLGADTTPLGSL